MGSFSRFCSAIGGALLGGVEGYKKSGGGLGAAALGSGLGALGGGGLRMAGSALAGQALLANPVYRAVADKAAGKQLSPCQRCKCSNLRLKARVN